MSVGIFDTIDADKLLIGCNLVPYLCNLPVLWIVALNGLPSCVEESQIPACLTSCCLPIMRFSFYGSDLAHRLQSECLWKVKLAGLASELGRGHAIRKAAAS